jgi:hypothetical protein
MGLLIIYLKGHPRAVLASLPRSTLYPQHATQLPMLVSLATGATKQIYAHYHPGTRPGPGFCRLKNRNLSL